MSDKKYKAAVIIGRFQPFHLGHKALMQSALKIADKLIVIVGSTNIPRTPKNPFTYAERNQMIYDSFTDDDDIRVFGVEDTMYSDQQWVSEVQFAVDTATKDNDSGVVLVGHHRDDSSYYLDMFPQWKFVEMPAYEDDIAGTEIRDEYYNQRYLDDYIPKSSCEVIGNFTLSSKGPDSPYNVLVREYNYIEEYKEMLGKFQYPINLVTTDAVVVQSGHVLMIKRGGFPGKGLWAIPGGYLDTNERIIDGIVRELREETKVKIAEKVLRGSLKNIEVFDAPSRSERGRVITHAALFVLEEGHILPKVKGSDDAVEARWIPLSMLRRMRSEIFEDHFDIIFKLTNTL